MPFTLNACSSSETFSSDASLDFAEVLAGVFTGVLGGALAGVDSAAFDLVAFTDVLLGAGSSLAVESTVTSVTFPDLVDTMIVDRQVCVY